MSSTLRNLLLVALVAVAGSVGVLGCGGGGGEEDDGRSTEAFCDTLHSEKERILEEMSPDSEPADDLDEAVQGFSTIVAGVSGLQTYFDKLADVAPSEIESEMQEVSDSYESQLDSLGDIASDPLGAAFGSVVEGASSSTQLERVNQFALDNCGESI